MDGATEVTGDRRAWMGLMVRAPAGRIAALLDETTARPRFEWLRAPEYGSVMVRGRTGASGAPFNLGEMTVTRCALRLETGEEGHAWLQGRRREDAEAAALVDALMQTEAAEDLRAHVLAVLRAEAGTRRTTRAAKAAATKVDFFTMMRGEA
jgi:alpha-D-ribose 1-methylphosphonate 5-triphosphate synthase subunit PhnG